MAERLLLILLSLVLLIPKLSDLAATYPLWIRPQKPSFDILVARDLHQLGIQPGDGIATVGEGFSHHYAHIARARIVAQITHEGDFWSLPSEDAVAVERALARTGAKLLLGRDRPDAFQSGSWRAVSET